MTARGRTAWHTFVYEDATPLADRWLNEDEELELADLISRTPVDPGLLLYGQSDTNERNR